MKVMCIEDPGWLYKGPKENEICIVDAIDTGYFGKTYYQLKGYDEVQEYGGRVNFNTNYFREIDEDFAEEVLSKVKKQIKEEELVTY